MNYYATIASTTMLQRRLISNTSLLTKRWLSSTPLTNPLSKVKRSHVQVAMEYSDLNLDYNSTHDHHIDMGRMRQHVNPLSAVFTVPAKIPDWKELYRDPELPLMVDIGTGSGRFLIWLAKNSPETRNHLGLEIRRKMVERSQLWVREMTLTNIHFLFANAAVSFEQLVSSYPGPLIFVSVLCPDPYFKKKHHKRRVLQKPLVDSILKYLRPGGQVFVQSDVLEVAIDMRSQFDAQSDTVQHIDTIDSSTTQCDDAGWLLSNPMGIRTEREIHAEFEGAKVYRRMYQKRDIIL